MGKEKEEVEEVGGESADIVDAGAYAFMLPPLDLDDDDECVINLSAFTGNGDDANYAWSDALTEDEKDSYEIAVSLADRLARRLADVLAREAHDTVTEFFHEKVRRRAGRGKAWTPAILKDKLVRIFAAERVAKIEQEVDRIRDIAKNWVDGEGQIPRGVDTKTGEEFDVENISAGVGEEFDAERHIRSLNAYHPRAEEPPRKPKGPIKRTDPKVEE